MTSNFPNGNILVPVTVLGITSDGMSLLGCSMRWTSISHPDAEISASEFGRTVTSLEPFAELMLTVISGAGSEDAMW